MNALILVAVASLAAFASASGIHGAGAIVSGPSGIVTNAGPIGPTGLAGTGLTLGLGHGAAIAAPAIAASAIAAPAIAAPALAAQTLVAAPALATRTLVAAPVLAARTLVAVPALAAAPLGIGIGAIAAPAIAAPAIAAPAIAAAPIGIAKGAITNGGGTIGVSAHGAAIRGPPTSPIVVAGPSGKVAADGLWGPTANVGLTGHAGGW